MTKTIAAMITVTFLGMLGLYVILIYGYSQYTAAASTVNANPIAKLLGLNV